MLPMGNKLTLPHTRTHTHTCTHTHTHTHWWRVYYIRELEIMVTRDIMPTAVCSGMYISFGRPKRFLLSSPVAIALTLSSKDVQYVQAFVCVCVYKTE